MTETPARKPRPRRTFSTFGDVRRMPSEYEIVTHAQNWTLRQNRTATFEQNPSSAPNLWFLTYRENSPLQAENWDAFRDPDALTYKAYVNLQAEAEAKVQGVLETHAEAGITVAAESVALLGQLFTPARYLYHGFQQVEAYIGYMAPSSYITNAAAFATADFLRRVTTIAYRTRELQIASPDSGIGAAERARWEGHDGWQPARKAVEYALVSYDWGEAFTALNLVLAPTLDDVLLTQLGRVARSNGDDLTWLLRSFLAEDSRRRGRWSRALAQEAGCSIPSATARRKRADVEIAKTAKTARWRETISIEDLREGDMTAVMVDGEAVLLVNIDGTVRAYSNRCPHQASALDEGDLDGETLTCAKHLWEFNASTGCGINPDDARLTGFGCQVGDDGTIYVDIGR